MEAESLDNKHGISKYHTVLQMLLFASAYLIWNYGAFININPSTGLDKSWIVGLNWASHLGLPWNGNSLVFTYGPLYYLSGLLLSELHPPYMSELLNIGLTMFYLFGSIYIYSLFSSSFTGDRKRWLSSLAAAVLILQGMKTEMALYLSIFIFLSPLVQLKTPGQKNNYAANILRYILISLILATLPFIKFSYFFPSIFYVVLMIFYLVHQKLLKDGLILGASFSVATLLIWIIVTRQNVASYFSYLRPRLILTNGYSEAMMLDFISPAFAQLFIFCILIFFIFGTSILYLVIIHKINWAILWMLPFIGLFIGFKQAFVRADGHVLKIFDHIFFALILYFYMLYINDDSKAKKLNSSWWIKFSELYTPYFSFILLCSFTVWAIQYLILDRPHNILPGNILARNQFSASNFEKSYQRSFLKGEYNLEQDFINRINPNKGIDVIPWDIALLYAYELPWQPRPVIQSYAAYTAELDNLDAAFFKSNRSPDQIILSTIAIDGRYVLFDIPKVFQSILLNYDMTAVNQDGRYALLDKKQHPQDSKLILISEETVSWGEKIKIPEVENAHVIMTAEIDSTIRGKIVNILYKTSPINLVFSLKGGENVNHRFIRDLGQNGLFVSKYVRNLQDLNSIFENTYEQDIKSISFEGDPKYYNSSFVIHFYKMMEDQ